MPNISLLSLAAVPEPLSVDGFDFRSSDLLSDFGDNFREHAQ